MTYEELYNGVCGFVPAHRSFSIQVETWKHGTGSPETKWQIHVAAYGNGDSTQHEGPTAADAFNAFAASFVREWVDETSADVGNALEDRS
jgi:hypothetical protein